MRIHKLGLITLILFLLVSVANFGVYSQETNKRPSSGPGVYLVEVAEGTERLVLIEPSNYTKAVVSAQSINGKSSGDKGVRSRISVEGARAKIKLNTFTTRPRFSFYFAGTNPSDILNSFVLIRMDIEENRRVLTGQLNDPFEPITDQEKKDRNSIGYIVNYQVRKKVPVEFEATSQVVRVTPIGQLSDGEYCFFYRGSTPLFELFKLRNSENAFCFSANGAVPGVPERHP